MPDVATAEFRPDDILTWRRVENQVPTERRVRFVEYDGTERAVVTWGVSYEGKSVRYTARLAELSRPQPAALPWYLSGRIEVPKPPTTDQLTERLTQCREQLRAAHATARHIQDVAAEATKVADRARREVDAARAELVALNAHDDQSLRELEQALREGRPAAQMKNGIDRSEVKARVERAEAALQRFDRELAEANVSMTTALSECRKSAFDVIGALVERESENLRRVEILAATQRAELHAVAHWWPSADLGAPKLAPAAAQLLAAVPNYGEVPVVRQVSIAPWKELFDKLVQDADADFQIG
jgi:hypothetical protein